MYSQIPSVSGVRSSIRNLRTRHAVVTGTTYHVDVNNNHYYYYEREAERVLKYKGILEIQVVLNVKTNAITSNNRQFEPSIVIQNIS